MRCYQLWADKQHSTLAKEAEELGIWAQYHVRLIGVDIKAIDKAEDREQFSQWMIALGVPVARPKPPTHF
jgi:carbamoyl-phosphate synthase large subunit